MRQGGHTGMEMIGESTELGAGLGLGMKAVRKSPVGSPAYRPTSLVFDTHPAQALQ